MKLDFNPATNAYILRVPRAEFDPTVLMQEYGLDFAEANSTPTEAVLFTRQPYVAASFAHLATPRAAAKLQRITAEIEKSWATETQSRFTVPPDKELWAFQNVSVEYATQRTHSLIADPPGLGKTMDAVVLSNEMQAKRNLVICPASIRLQWAEKILEWSWPRITRADIAILLSSRYGTPSSQWWERPGRHWAIISWDLIHNEGLWKALVKEQYDLLILDEAHNVRNNETRRSRMVFGGGDKPVDVPLKSRCERVLALTGTPLPKRLSNAYNITRHLCPDAIDFMSQDRFEAHYNSVETGTFSRADGSIGFWKDEWSGNEAELQNRLRANLMVRHNKRDVMPQLSYPTFNLIRVLETKSVRAALAAERLLEIDLTHLEAIPPELWGDVEKSRQEMGIAMAPQIAGYARECFDGGEDKLAIFAWHTAVLDILQKELAPFGVIRIDGSTSPKNKFKRVKEFQDDPKKRVILGNVLSLGTGTDGLQNVCSHGLLAEADWVFGNNEQCADRLDRGGQRNKVQFDIFAAPGSIAEKVLEIALSDAKTAHKALDRKASDRLQLVDGLNPIV